MPTAILISKAIRKQVAALTVLALVLIAGEPIKASAGCGVSSKMAAALTAGASVYTPSLPSKTRQVEQSSGRNEPIVGLWQIIVKDSSGNLVDRVFSGWTGDGLEFDQDIAPILTGYVCYGTYVKLSHGTYGLTHPFFNFQDVNSNGEGSESTEGQWDGNSGFFNYTVAVSNDGKHFTGREFIKVVQGPNPYNPNATVLFTGNFTLAATKIRVNISQLP